MRRIAEHGLTIVIPDADNADEPLPEESVGQLERQSRFTLDLIKEQSRDGWTLGVGKSGRVWFGRSPEYGPPEKPPRLCVKTIHDPDASVNTLEREFDMHERFRMAGVRVPALRLFVRGERPDDEGEYDEALVMEASTGSNLEETLLAREKERRPFTRKEFEKIYNGIAEQIVVAHKANLYHRDLHMRNIMVDDDLTVSLIDFGDAIQALDDEDQDSEGIRYQEVFRNGKKLTFTFNRKDERVLQEFTQLVQNRGLLTEEPAATLDNN